MGVSPLAILPVRQPLEVARSLQARYGFTLNSGLLLWLRHVLDAEANSRRVPRSIVVRPRFFGNLRGEIRRIATDLGIDWPRDVEIAMPEIEAFLTHEFQREHVGEVEFQAHPEIYNWALTVYEAVVRLSEEPLANSACVEIERVREKFDNFCLSFASLTDKNVDYLSHAFDSTNGLSEAQAAEIARSDDFHSAAAEVAVVMPSAPEASDAEVTATSGASAAAGAAIPAERAELNLVRARLGDMAQAIKVERDTGSRLLAAKDGELATLKEAFAAVSAQMTQMARGIAALTGIIGRRDEETSRFKAHVAAAQDAATRETEALQAGKVAAEAEAQRLINDIAALQAAAALNAAAAAQAQAHTTALQDSAARETEALQAGKGAAEALGQRLAVDHAALWEAYVGALQAAAYAQDAVALETGSLLAGKNAAEAEAQRVITEISALRDKLQTATALHAEVLRGMVQDLSAQRGRADALEARLTEAAAKLVVSQTEAAPGPLRGIMRWLRHKP